MRVSRQTGKRAAVRHPVAGSVVVIGLYVALLTLAINDHVLKGGGLLPGWLTGKLSDFAGLVVLPVVLAVLLRVRSRITRHGGTDLDAPDEWMRWFEDGEPAQETREGALFVEKKVKYEEDGDVLWA